MPNPYVISLVLHQKEKPGWRIHLANGIADPDEGQPISIKDAEEIARSATSVTNVEAQITPFIVVRNGTTALRSLLEEALAEAESKAATIGNLRRALQEMGD